MNEVVFTTESKTYKVGKDDNLTLFDVLIDGDDQKRDIEVILDGEGARVQIYGLFFGNGAQQFTSSHIVRHRAPHTSSVLVTKGALNDQAMCDYASNIIIEEGNSGCSGEQKEDTLLLSREAHVDAVPALEIANDDVQASHSVSTTYIDDIKRFYLESRGMGEQEAVQTIVQGHFADILDKIEDEDTRQGIGMKIIEKL